MPHFVKIKYTPLCMHAALFVNPSLLRLVLNVQKKRRRVAVQSRLCVSLVCLLVRSRSIDLILILLFPYILGCVNPTSLPLLPLLVVFPLTYICATHLATVS